MKTSNFILIAVLGLILTNCAVKPEPQGNVFIPKEVDPIEIETGIVTLCKEVILDEKGNNIDRLRLLKGEVSFTEIFYHKIQCIESAPPFRQYTIPREEWYNNFDPLFVRISYKQLKIKLAETDFMCSLAEHTNLKCNQVIDRIDKLDQFLIKEQ